MPDISSRDDLEQLLRGFYERALADPLLRHVFVDVVNMDLEAHLPRVTDFWQRVLFRTGAYEGRPMEVHQRVHGRVPLTGGHFGRWLELWREAVSADFAGPVADQAVAHATRMASGFLRNLVEPGYAPRTLALATARSARSVRAPLQRLDSRHVQDALVQGEPRAVPGAVPGLLGVVDPD